jgi:hypothetical protein
MNREEILKTKTVKTESVDVPEWGGTLFVHSLNGLERVKFFDRDVAEKLGEESPARMGIMLLIHCLRDEQGQHIFLPEDAAQLEEQDGQLVNRLCAIANRVNGIGQDAADAAKKN